MPEFSFGLRNVVLDPPGLSALGLGKTTISIHELNKVTGNLSKAISSLVTSSDVVLALSITGWVFGVAALISGAMGMMDVPPDMCSTCPKRKFFHAALGLLGLDAIFMLVVILIYTLGVMPSLGALGIQEFFEHFAKALVENSIVKALISQSVNCKHPVLMFGAVGTIIQIVLLALTVIVVGLGLDLSPSSSGFEGDSRTPALQMQHLHQGPGPGYGGQPGYGGPPPGYGQGGPPGAYAGPYEGPPSASGGMWAAPPPGGPGYGGPDMRVSLGGPPAPAGRW